MRSAAADILDRPEWLRASASQLGRHGACCDRARAWLVAMARSHDFAATDGLALAAPRWLNRRFQWGPTQWPIAWCEAVKAQAIDCGVFGALALEIFFVPDARVGLGLAAAVTLGDRRIGVSMIAASIAAVAIGYLAGSPAWQVEQGLAGFTPALIAAAALCRFAGIGRVAVAVAIVSGAFLEAGALRLTGALGLYALSTSYLLFVWVFALLRPVRDAADRPPRLVVDRAERGDPAAAGRRSRRARRPGRGCSTMAERAIAVDARGATRHIGPLVRGNGSQCSARNEKN